MYVCDERLMETERAECDPEPQVTSAERMEIAASLSIIRSGTFYGGYVYVPLHLYANIYSLFAFVSFSAKISARVIASYYLNSVLLF